MKKWNQKEKKIAIDNLSDRNVFIYIESISTNFQVILTKESIFTNQKASNDLFNMSYHSKNYF